MNIKAINFVKNFLYTLVSNLLPMLLSILVVLVVPKLIGVEEYGYWQLYLFYSSYVGFLHFGWNDGIYLRYGGKDYNELDKKMFFSQFYMLIALQFILVIIIVFISNIFIFNHNKIFIYEMIAFCMLISNVRCMLVYILQITNRIKEYAHITIMDRILYCLIIVVFLLVGFRDYKMMIVADLIGKLISLSYSMYCCKDMVFLRISTFYFSFKETLENISVGIKIMFANIASSFIVGIVRFGIEYSWYVTIFGKISIVLNISNLMMLFIDAVGIIMFPILKRTNETKLSSIYVTIRDFLMIILLGALIVYYPLKLILLAWLPQYADGLKYMALLFPVCVFEGKISLLINTYLKTLRKEKLMLKINLISVGFSIVLTFVNTVQLKNLDLAIASIVILLAFRCVLAESYLSKILSISLYKDTVLELIMTLIFIMAGWFINSWIVVLVYAIAYVIYLLIKLENVIKTIKNIKLLISE